MYTFTGPSVLVIKALQALLGSITCVLTAGLGRRVVGPRAGLWAGLMAALYGPLIFYEAAELLAAGSGEQAAAASAPR